MPYEWPVIDAFRSVFVALDIARGGDGAKAAYRHWQCFGGDRPPVTVNEDETQYAWNDRSADAVVAEVQADAP